MQNVIVVAKLLLLTVLSAVSLVVVACGGSDAPASTPVSAVASIPSPTSAPAMIAASALTGPPTDMTGINAMHEVLESENADILFGTQADPLTVTLGPTNGGFPDYPAYDGKNSLNFKMPLRTPVIAPLDVMFIGFKNRSATYKQDTSDAPRMEPFDDLELCFESAAADWPGMVMCVYHLHTTPLLQAHLQNDDCGIQEKWGGEVAEAGRVYYLKNSSERSNRNPESCDPLLGQTVKRGEVLGYSGQVGTNAHSGFRFKVQSEDMNPLTNDGDPFLHWVQPKPFFYWQCFDPDTKFLPGVLAYPFDCGLIEDL
jgi:hypothetical protein